MAERDIETTVGEAHRECTFYRRQRNRVLVRENGEKRDRLVDGEWIWRKAPVEPPEWTQLSENELRFHVRRYLTEDLMSPRVHYWQHPFRRLRLSAVGRWALPALKGGAARKIDKNSADRARDSYTKSLGMAGEVDRTGLKEQAEAGLEQQQQRGSGAEQKANFFLGAAGLTTSLVLANAGLLVGTDKLHDPWRIWAAAALILASICALISGVRALQAAMATFSRTPPNSVGRLLGRMKTDKDEFQRCHIAALLVAQGRAGTVADWKIERMSAARRWFAGVVAGVILLTGFVLANAFDDDPPNRIKAQFVSASVPETGLQLAD